MTEYQKLHLGRLADVFRVDVSEAFRLEGEELEIWIEKAEDFAFDRLYDDFTNMDNPR